MTELTPLDRRLLKCVTDEPQTATKIWRRFAGIRESKHSLTSANRKQRRIIAQRLEDLAAAGQVQVDPMTRHGVVIPAYSAKQPPAGA